MTIDIICDFETASDANLKKVGAWRYAEDPTTEVLCLVCDIPGVPDYYTWRPGQSGANLRDMAEGTERFVSHGGFEQAIWQRIMVEQFGFPPLPPERWHDTQSVCAWKSLPLALEKVSKALHLTTQKDMDGNRLTLSLSKPNKKTGMLDRSPESLARVVEYCKTDVAGELELHRRIGELSEKERDVWLLDQRINHRGVRIDLGFVAACQRVVDAAVGPLTDEFREITGGINPGQVAKIVEWCRGQGVALDNLQKGTINGLLGGSEDDDDEPTLDDGDVSATELEELPGSVRRALEIRGMLGSASVKKLAAMRNCVGYDGRARGLGQYHAAHTGRWGGRILQPQNFPRGDWGRRDIEPGTVVSAILSGCPGTVESALETPAIKAVGDALRFALVADPGKKFISGDFAGIEMRVVLALAGQHDKCALLASGADVYLDMACDIYNKPRGFFNKKEHVPERTIGKNTVLGCGFQMGAAKFHERYCPEQPIEFAERVVDAYRNQWAPMVPELWYGLQGACWSAFNNGYGEHAGCEFRKAADGWCTIDLPSGWQRLWYPEAGLTSDYANKYFRSEDYRVWYDTRATEHQREVANRPNPSYMKYGASGSMRHGFYGGLLTENIVQALARGLLCQAMSRLEKAGYPLVLTVHDECVAEVDEDVDIAPFSGIMAASPTWAQRIGIPIEVEGWEGTRYRK